MPKEYIHDSTTKMFKTKVGWSKEDGHVQIATVTNSKRLGLSEFNPHTEAWTPVETGGTDEGWHVTLDRKEINDLIRLLRKARDQAFGRDA